MTLANGSMGSRSKNKPAMVPRQVLEPLRPQGCQENRFSGLPQVPLCQDQANLDFPRRRPGEAEPHMAPLVVEVASTKGVSTQHLHGRWVVTSAGALHVAGRAPGVLRLERR